MCSSSGTPSSAAPCGHVVPADTSSEGLVLELLLDARDLEIGQTARRADQGTRHEKPAQLVDREERLGHRRVAGDAGVVGVTEDGTLHRLGQAFGREPADALGRMLLGGRMRRVGKSLVVEVVQQADEPPGLGIFALALGHGPHRDLDGIHVFPQRVGCGVLVHESEGAVSREHRGLSRSYCCAYPAVSGTRVATSPSSVISKA